MTAWKSYPALTVDLPEDGKVTGSLYVWFMGEGRVGARTDYNRVLFRDQEFSVHVQFTRQPDGTWTEGKYNSVRRDFSDAPPTYRDKIVGAVRDLIVATWTPDYERAGTEADVAQNLHRLEEQEATLVADLDAVRAKIAEENRRLSVTIHKVTE